MEPQRGMRKAFDDIVSRLATVRAGRLGVITLGEPLSFSDNDPLIGPARVWESETPYRATRHAGRGKDQAAALIRYVIAESRRRSLPRPKVKLLEFSALPNGGGLTARMKLHFATAIHGPLLLGRRSHKGGGVSPGERNELTPRPH
jgi:CRISPR-associated protein Csb2